MKKLVLFKKRKERKMEERKDLAIKLQVKTEQSDAYRQLTNALVNAMKHCDDVKDATLLQNIHENVLVIRQKVADERKALTERIAEFK